MSQSDLIADIEAISKSRKRLFEAGEMKLLVLHFISQQPKYSYDIIKDISALVGGNYKPSTGTIFPNINDLEKQGYTDVHLSEDKRKQYHINQKGLDHLQTKKQTLEKTLTRFNTRNKIQTNADLMQIKQAMEQLKAALSQQLKDEIHPQKVADIAEKIHQAALNIQAL